MKVAHTHRGTAGASLFSAARCFTILAVLAIAAFAAPYAEAAPGASPAGHAAQTVAVNERVATRLTSHKGTTVLNEQGQGSGTFKCSLTLQIKISYTSATISFLCALTSGTLSGSGSTSFVVAGDVSHFNGTIAITHGTGKYSHASARSLHIQGTLQRSNYSLSATVAGSMSN